MKTAVKLG